MEDKNDKLNKAGTIINTLRKAGFEAMIVGGAVRDKLMGKESNDYDIATNAPPEKVEKLFSRTLGVGKQFGVILVLIGKDQFEVATFRKDVGYSDGRRPDAVEFAEARDDVLRRDFTINGLFWHPEKDEIIDYVGGVKDIERRLIRCIGDPYKRFEEDKLRVLRAIRFSSNLGFEIEEKTWGALCDRKLFSLAVISKERIRAEFEKIITRPNAFRGLKMIREAELQELVLSNFFFSKEDDYDCFFRFLPDLNCEISLERALACLYLASGKFSEIIEGDMTVLSRKVYDPLLLELRDYLKGQTYSGKTTDGVFNILKLIFDLLAAKDPDRALIRRSLGHFWGRETYFVIRRLEKVFDVFETVGKKLEEVLKVYQTSVMLPKPYLGGADLLAKGMKAGPEFSKILEEAYTIQLRDDNLTRESLIEELSSRKLI